MNRKLTITALSAIIATGFAGGFAYADPAGPDTVLHGIDQGVAYDTDLTADGSGVTTTLADGRFDLAADGKSVTLTDAGGAQVATLPMAVQVSGTRWLLDPRIDDAGRSLTLTPVGAAALTPEQQIQAHRTFVDYNADIARHQHNAAVGALIGLGIGIIVGFPFFVVGAIPGGVLGAAIGAIIGWIVP
ncbi:hypothetical protein ACFXHA_25520 [Nocardia sp. NPDC059240]|uniref:hypothetical protein n=1 Tax=Nocardia sp. NPDC059240 TaxID=3346786 RepID=UPI00368C6D6A